LAAGEAPRLLFGQVGTAQLDEVHRSVTAGKAEASLLVREGIEAGWTSTSSSSAPGGTSAEMV
jgi:hypothetical protein